MRLRAVSVASRTAATLASVLALGAAVAESGAAATSPTPSALERALEGIVENRQGPPGALMLIHRPGRDEFFRAGVADVRSGAPLQRFSHFRIASVSKAFNGAVALSLVDRGDLSLDETIERGIPGLLPLAGPVTLSELLQHTGGVPDYIRAKAFIERFTEDPSAYIPPRTLIGFVRDDPLEFAPGSRYHYSDTDNIAAGLMAERASGQSYDQLLSDLVYRPLRLFQTSLPRTVRMPRPLMHGYDVEAGRAPEDVSELINPAGAWASGGIVSTPTDLGRFIRGYVSGRLFGGAVRRAQFSFRPGDSSPPGPGSNASGLGLFRYRTPCGTLFGHTGSFPGYRIFAAANGNGNRSVVFVASAQIVPGQGSKRVSDAIRSAQGLAVCRALG